MDVSRSKAHSLQVTYPNRGTGLTDWTGSGLTDFNLNLSPTFNIVAQACHKLSYQDVRLGCRVGHSRAYRAENAESCSVL